MPQDNSHNSHSQSVERWLKFLRWYCPPKLYEGIEGDLLEQFELDKNEIGLHKAEQRFARHVLRFCSLEIILRNKYSLHLINIIMLQNYLLVAFRNAWK